MSRAPFWFLPCKKVFDVQSLAMRVTAYAQLAQLVEQRTENPRVLGSIPRLGTKKSSDFYLVIFLCFKVGLRFRDYPLLVI